jgi:16S rRNA (uracil1498-N3)-methyltransferase
LHEKFSDSSERKPKLVLAIGPEGGWESSEIELFASKNFEVINAGKRIMRTDIAVNSLLGWAHEYLEYLKARSE